MFAAFLLLSCSPIVDCPSTEKDCCTNDAQCWRFYGDVAPYCHRPGQRTGVCAECVGREDCRAGERCVEQKTELGGFCAPR